MPYIRDLFWRSRQFDSLSAMQTAAVRWSLEVAGRRARRALDGAAPAAVFAAVEQPTVHRAAPGAVRAGRRVAARRSARTFPPGRQDPLLGALAVDRAACRRPRHPHHGAGLPRRPAGQDPYRPKPRGKQTDMTDYPPEKIAFHMRTPTGCREQAAEIGPACVRVVGELLEVNALFRLRAAQGVLGLAPRHSPARLEAAGALAVSVGDPSYRTIKGILVAGTEHQPAARASGDGGTGFSRLTRHSVSALGNVGPCGPGYRRDYVGSLLIDAECRLAAASYRGAEGTRARQQRPHPQRPPGDGGGEREVGARPAQALAGRGAQRERPAGQRCGGAGIGGGPGGRDRPGRGSGGWSVRRRPRGAPPWAHERDHFSTELDGLGDQVVAARGQDAHTEVAAAVGVGRGGSAVVGGVGGRGVGPSGGDGDGQPCSPLPPSLGFPSAV